MLRTCMPGMLEHDTERRVARVEDDLGAHAAVLVYRFMRKGVPVASPCLIVLSVLFPPLASRHLCVGLTHLFFLSASSVSGFSYFSSRSHRLSDRNADRRDIASVTATRKRSEASGASHPCEREYELKGVHCPIPVALCALIAKSSAVSFAIPFRLPARRLVLGVGAWRFREHGPRVVDVGVAIRRPGPRTLASNRLSVMSRILIVRAVLAARFQGHSDTAQVSSVFFGLASVAHLFP